MTRSNAREIAVHLIYALECSDAAVEEALAARFEEDYYAGLSEENEVYLERPDAKQQRYIRQAVRGVDEHRAELEALLAKYSIGWNVSRISRLAKAAMELAMYEALYMQDVPVNVAIHEAVLLCQKYEEPETVSFVNGVLGSFSRGLEKQQ